MRSAVITFPGSNCDRDALTALQKVGSKVQKIWHQETKLEDNLDLIVVPGGFSYGDYLRSGAMAAISPVMMEVKRLADKGVRVLGICNGFQILCESQLLPGALLHNDHQKFNCKNVFIKAQTNHSLITSKIDLNKALKIPVAHGEGRFYCDESTLKILTDNDQILFRYCDENGNNTLESNPNGSLQNIAGICNENRNVFGMMPHPERAVDANIYNTDGRLLFESLLGLVAQS